MRQDKVLQEVGRLHLRVIELEEAIAELLREQESQQEKEQEPTAAPPEA